MKTQNAGTAIPPSAWLLVAVNLVPLAGVAFLGWRVADVVMLYWIENVVIGVLNVPRILLAEKGDGRLTGAVFFVAHYGLFCLGHGAVLAELFGGGDLRKMLLEMAARPPMLFAVAGFLVSHLFSLWHNYIVGSEYRAAEVEQLMLRPYYRIFVVHAFVIGGGFVLQATTSPLAALAVFTLIKTAIDFHMHRREREILAQGEGTK
jgi:hypothetical protein